MDGVPAIGSNTMYTGPLRITPEIDISNLMECSNEIKRLVRTSHHRGLFSQSNTYSARQALTKLNDCTTSYPRIFSNGFIKPLMNRLNQLPPDTTISETGTNNLLFDLVEAVFQRCQVEHSPEEQRMVYALQHVVSDLYRSFLDYESNQGVLFPDAQPGLPPLCKFDSDPSRNNGNVDLYTFPATSVAKTVPGSQVAVVSFSHIFTRGGIVAWTALPHEVVGHDFLRADRGLLDEIKDKVHRKVLRGTNNDFLARYWSYTIDEAASDVMGILNAGPAAALGLIAYFRGLSKDRKLHTEQMIDRYGKTGVHPTGFIRGILASHALRLCCFDEADSWATTVYQEVITDVAPSKLKLGSIPHVEEQTFDDSIVSESARIVADTLINTRLERLENRSLGQIKNWNNQDHARAEYYKNQCESRHPQYVITDQAAHVLAGATLASLKTGANKELIFDNMISILAEMHKQNEFWFPRRQMQGGFRLPSNAPDEYYGNPGCCVLV